MSSSLSKLWVKAGGLRRWLRRNRAGILGGLIASAILVPLVIYVALELARTGAP